MANEELSEKEIKDLLIKFNLDESINDLKMYYATPTTWEIIKQSRRETSHTQFLAWFMGNKEFNANPNTGPIKKLVVLLLKWSNRQNQASFDPELAESIYSQDFYINTYNVEAEYPINIGQIEDSEPAYGDGDVDILITAVIKINNKEKLLRIVIENKIGSPETVKCFDKDGKLLKKPNKGNTKTTLYQTKAYHHYFSSEDFEKDFNLFVYLKPTDCSLDDIHEAECACKNYIQINYQELLDNIIQPVYEQKDISDENAFRLKDYIKTLGKPSENEENNTNKRITIMAMEQKERELLLKFYEKNEELIRAAINALGDKALSESMSNVPKRHHYRRSYTINGTGNYAMYDVLEEFIKFKLEDPQVKVKDINDEILSYVGGKKIYVSDTPNRKVYREDSDDNKQRFGTLTLTNGHTIRYTKEWGDGDDNQNFAKFRKGVSSKYQEDFVINPV